MEARAHFFDRAHQQTLGGSLPHFPLAVSMGAEEFFPPDSFNVDHPGGIWGWIPLGVKHREPLVAGGKQREEPGMKWESA